MCGFEIFTLPDNSVVTGPLHFKIQDDFDNLGNHMGIRIIDLRGNGTHYVATPTLAEDLFIVS